MDAAPLLVRDPGICGGALTIRGRGITIATVHARWLNGETIASLATDYDLEPAVVEQVLREWYGLVCERSMERALELL